MKSIRNLLFSGVTLHCVAGIAIASDIGKSYQLYHKLGSQSELTPRGKILISPSDNDGIGLSATFIKDNSAKLDTDAFDSMVDSTALYTVVVIEDGDDKSSLSLSSLNGAPHVSASVPGCSLRRSNLREEISLSISPTGKLQSVSYRPLISPLASKSCDNLKSLSEKPEAIYGREGGNDEPFPFKTTVEFESHKPMPTIPIVLPQTRPPAGLKWYRRNAKNSPNPFLGGSNVENKGGIPFVDEEAPAGFKSSFLYKYWYIILPLALMGLFGGVEEEPVQDTRGGAPVVATTMAGAAAASGGQARQRRGKRD
eukprot:scaffold5563_cov111-Skeletonema_dohrnii-CCMP3373.AAC.1